MKKKKSSEHEDDDDDEHQFEILKAVAQAWLGQSGNSRTANEFDAHRLNFQTKPSRFKLEAMNKSAAASKRVESANYWDFKQSLWDSYEIVNVSKRLERGLLLDNPFSGSDIVQSSSSGRGHRKRRESKNSLRNLFNMMSSRRFNESDVTRKDINDTQIDY